MEFRHELSPPLKGGGGGLVRDQEEAREIRENAPCWGKLRVLPHGKHDSARATALAIKRGRRAAFRPAGAYDARTRVTGEGVAIWVRYLGNPDDGQGQSHKSLDGMTTYPHYATSSGL